jgi:dihydroorotase
MIHIKNVKMIHGLIADLEIPSEMDEVLDATGLTALPAVIDPHVHFRTPGLEHKEDWTYASKAAINGGCTMVFDMPNVLPPTITEELLVEKKALIDKQLKDAGIPLSYDLYIGADKSHFDQLPLVRDQVVGIKVFMGCSTGDLVIDDDESLDTVFKIAAENDMLVAVHAEDEDMMKERKEKYFDANNYSCHSEIRNIDVAVTAVKKAISLSKKYSTRLYILHVSSAEEIEIIRQAKQDGTKVYAETTPHHLYFDNTAYTELKGKACVNPALRDKANHTAIIKAIKDGVIDTIGSDHAPHTPEEKDQPYGKCPSGMPGIEFMLPMLLNKYHHGELTLEDIVRLTSENAQKIFRINGFQDWVLVDLDKKATVKGTASKCGWSPYMGQEFTGWPTHVVMKGKVYNLHAAKATA